MYLHNNHAQRDEFKCEQLDRYLKICIFNADELPDANDYEPDTLLGLSNKQTLYYAVKTLGGTNVWIRINKAELHKITPPYYVNGFNFEPKANIVLEDHDVAAVLAAELWMTTENKTQDVDYKEVSAEEFNNILEGV